MSRVLLVDDDPVLLRTLRMNLAARSHHVVPVSCGRDALGEVFDDPPDVVVLDLGLPDMDGIDVLRRIREQSSVPVIVLSARHESDDKVEALDAGADDYVTKPFGMEEFLARVRSGLRRGGASDDTPPFQTRSLRIDFASTTARRDGKLIHLTPTEWRLLAELSRARGRVVPHEALLKAAWGPSYGRELNYLRVFANQLRRKLESDPSRPVHLVTEPGIGYRLVGE